MGRLRQTEHGMAKTIGKRSATKSKSASRPVKNRSPKPKAPAKKRATTKRRSPALAKATKAKPAFVMRIATTTGDDPLPLRWNDLLPRALVARKAYELWEQRVRAANDAHQNWRDAEEELRGSYAVMARFRH
jgi:hypothetical protein